MNISKVAANKCNLKEANLDDEKFIEFLDWLGMNNEENRKLITEGNLLFFEEPWALEGVSVVDLKNNECVIIEYRGM